MTLSCLAARIANSGDTKGDDQNCFYSFLGFLAGRPRFFLAGEGEGLGELSLDDSSFLAFLAGVFFFFSGAGDFSFFFSGDFNLAALAAAFSSSFSLAIVCIEREPKQTKPKKKFRRSPQLSSGVHGHVPTWAWASPDRGAATVRITDSSGVTLFSVEPSHCLPCAGDHGHA